MKITPLFQLVAASATLISSVCADAPSIIAQSPRSFVQAEKAPDPEVSHLAEKVGFAAKLPKNTEGYFSVIGGYDMYERFLKTEVGKLILETMAEQGLDLEEVEGEPEADLFKASVGEEVFVSFGDTSGIQGVNLNALNRSANFHQMKMMVQMAAAAMSDEVDTSEMEGVAMSMFTGILGDPKAGLEIFEKSEMPPLLVGLKVSDLDMREQIHATVAGLLSQALEMGEEAPFTEINVQRDGVTLTGFSVDGKKAAALADEDTRQEMSGFFGGRAEVDRFLNAVAQKNLHIATGLKGDYILFYLGGTMDGFKLVEDPQDSLLAKDGMDFLRNYADKDIRVLMFGEGEAFNQMMEDSEAVSSIALGVKEGLSETDAFGDTRDIQTLLSHVARLDGQLFDMIDYSDSGMVGFLENGFKIESHGGSNLPSIDTKNPHAFSALGGMEDLLFYSNSRSNPEFTGKLYELIDSFGEAIYLMGRRVSELETEDFDFEQFRDGFQMFEQVAGKDLAEIWTAITVDWAQGTGDEGAIIIDTKGTMPKIPEIPGVVIEQGRIPRISYVTPVTNPEKLTQSWGKIEKSVTNILKALEEQGGPAIPMQELIENEKGGIRSFFYPIPTTTNNARPIVAMTEKNFYLSTSQTAVAEIKATLEKGGGPIRHGAYSRVNFSAASDFAQYWVDLAKKNADELFENDFQKDDFMENVPMIEKYIAAFAQFKDFTTHVRKEEGKSRMSIHFNLN